MYIVWVEKWKKKWSYEYVQTLSKEIWDSKIAQIIGQYCNLPLKLIIFITIKLNALLLT